MTLKKEDWSIIDKFKFEIKPIGVKYRVDPLEVVYKPEGEMALCEMLQKAQQNRPFYIDVSHHTCEAGAFVMGYEDIQQAFISGDFGAGLGAFKDFRAAAKVNNYIPTFSKRVLNYVAFEPI